MVEFRARPRFSSGFWFVLAELVLAFIIGMLVYSLFTSVCVATTSLSPILFSELACEGTTAASYTTVSDVPRNLANGIVLLPRLETYNAPFLRELEKALSSVNSVRESTLQCHEVLDNSVEFDIVREVTNCNNLDPFTYRLSRESAAGVSIDSIRLLNSSISFGGVELLQFLSEPDQVTLLESNIVGNCSIVQKIRNRFPGDLVGLDQDACHYTWFLIESILEDTEFLKDVSLVRNCASEVCPESVEALGSAFGWGGLAGLGVILIFFLVDGFIVKPEERVETEKSNLI